MLIEAEEPSVWKICTAIIIPDNERWLHTPESAASMKRALAWAQANAPSDTNVDEILARLYGEGRS